MLHRRFLKLGSIICFTMVVICGCGTFQPDSIQLLREELDIYMVRAALSLSDINKSMTSVDLAQDSLTDLKILQAKMEQFHIFAKPDIWGQLGTASPEIRDQVVVPKLWDEGFSDIPEIYFAVDQVRGSMVEPFINTLEKGGEIKEADISKWRKTQKHFVSMVESFKGIGRGSNKEFIKPEASQIEAAKEAVKNAKLLQYVDTWD